MINDRPFYGFLPSQETPSQRRCPFCAYGLTWDSGAQVYHWLRKLAGQTGANVVVFVADRNWLKTRQQEKGYHAMLQPLSKEKGWSIEDLKRFFLAETFGVTRSQIDGKEILVEPHTSTLSKANYSLLIERTLELAAERFEFWLEAPSEWKARKAAEVTRLARQSQVAA